MTSACSPSNRPIHVLVPGLSDPCGVVEARAPGAPTRTEQQGFGSLPLRRVQVPARAQVRFAAPLAQQPTRALDRTLLQVKAADAQHQSEVVAVDHAVDRILLVLLLLGLIVVRRPQRHRPRMQLALARRHTRSPPHRRTVRVFVNLALLTLGCVSSHLGQQLERLADRFGDRQTRDRAGPAPPSLPSRCIRARSARCSASPRTIRLGPRPGLRPCSLELVAQLQQQPLGGLAADARNLDEPRAVLRSPPRGAARPPSAPTAPTARCARRCR